MASDALEIAKRRERARRIAIRNERARRLATPSAVDRFTEDMVQPVADVAGGLLRGAAGVRDELPGGLAYLLGTAADVGLDLVGQETDFASRMSAPFFESAQAQQDRAARAPGSTAGRVAEFVGGTVPAAVATGAAVGGQVARTGGQAARRASTADMRRLIEEETRRRARSAFTREAGLDVAAGVAAEGAAAAGIPGAAPAAAMLVGSGAPLTALQRIAPGTFGTPRLWEDAAARRARRMVSPDDRPEAQRWRDQAADWLEEEVERVGGDPLLMRPSEQVLAAQAAEGGFADNFEGLAIRKTVSRPDDPFTGELQAQKRAGGERYGAERARQLPLADPARITRLREGNRARIAAAEARNQALWDLLDLDNRAPGIPGQDLAAAIDAIEKRAGKNLADFLPENEIEMLVNTETWGELQRMRTRLGLIAQEGDTLAPTAKQRARSGYATELIKAIDETIERAPGGLSRLWPQAKASHRRLREIYDRSTSAYQTMMVQENPAIYSGRLLDGKDNVQNVRQARAMIGDDAAALQDFRAEMILDTLTPPTEMGPKAMRNRFAKRRAALAEVFTDAELDAYDEILRQDVIETTSKAGRRGQNYGTAGGQSGLAQPGGVRPTIADMLNWMHNQGFGLDTSRNIVLSQFLLRPDKLAPVLRARQTSAGRDFGRLMLAGVVRAGAHGRGGARPEETRP